VVAAVIDMVAMTAMMLLLFRSPTAQLADGARVEPRA
jgi:hypothetical protein